MGKVNYIFLIVLNFDPPRMAQIPKKENWSLFLFFVYFIFDCLGL